MLPAGVRYVRNLTSCDLSIKSLASLDGRPMWLRDISVSFELDLVARNCRRFACIADGGRLGRGLTACVFCAHAKLLSGALERYTSGRDH